MTVNRKEENSLRLWSGFRPRIRPPVIHATPALAQSAMVLLRPVVVFPASRIRSSIFSHTRGTPGVRWRKFRLHNSKEDENNFPGVQFLYCIITLLINCIYSIYFVQGTVSIACQYDVFDVRCSAEQCSEIVILIADFSDETGGQISKVTY
jgi:hypothetical protein